jgi:hypothetical protein
MQNYKKENRTTTFFSEKDYCMIIIQKSLDMKMAIRSDATGMFMACHQCARPYPFPVQQYEQQHARQSVLPGGKHHDCQE